MIIRVRIASKAMKQLRKLPQHIVTNLMIWWPRSNRTAWRRSGRYAGTRDEPLKGDRQGQRSIRLSRAYRAIYIVKGDDTLEFASIEEVSKHDY